MYVYNAAWFSVAVVLTAVLGAGTVWMLRARGWRPAVFVSGLTLMPMALYLTGTMRVISVIVDQVAGYLTGFVFSPKVWLGLALGVVGIGLMVAGRRLSSGHKAPAHPLSTGPRDTEPVGGHAGELDDIEAILRKHGIQ